MYLWPPSFQNMVLPSSNLHWHVILLAIMIQHFSLLHRSNTTHRTLIFPSTQYLFFITLNSGMRMPKAMRIHRICWIRFMSSQRGWIIEVKVSRLGLTLCWLMKVLECTLEYLVSKFQRKKPSATFTYQIIGYRVAQVRVIFTLTDRAISSLFHRSSLVPFIHQNIWPMWSGSHHSRMRWNLIIECTRYPRVFQVVLEWQVSSQFRTSVEASIFFPSPVQSSPVNGQVQLF